LARHYRYSEEAVARAPHRAAEVLGLFTQKLQEQRTSGSEYLLGDTLSALDVYWATFLALCSPLSEDLCPMPDYLRQSYANIDETVRAALDPGLIEHRDFIYKTYLELPVELL
jgi:glutathione S-transferase